MTRLVLIAVIAILAVATVEISADFIHAARGGL